MEIDEIRNPRGYRENELDELFVDERDVVTPAVLRSILTDYIRLTYEGKILPHWRKRRGRLEEVDEEGIVLSNYGGKIPYRDIDAVSLMGE